MSLASQVAAAFTELATTVKGHLPKKSLASAGTTANLDPSTEWVGRWDITDDASPTSGWPDRLSFRFNGVRTGAFNEYGEGRFDAAKPSTVALRAHGNAGGASTPIFQVDTARGGDNILSVGDPAVDAQITNRSRDIYGLIVNRLDPAQATTDPDIAQFQYLSTRRTWINEKGMLRVGGVGADVRDEDTLKIVTDNTPGANAFVIMREDATTVMRVGALGRVNFNMGARLVGDTFEFRDSTDSTGNQTTVQQTSGGNLVLNNNSGDVLVVTPHGNLPLMPVWTGTQAQYDALTPDDGVLYVING